MAGHACMHIIVRYLHHVFACAHFYVAESVCACACTFQYTNLQIYPTFSTRELLDQSNGSAVICSVDDFFESIDPTTQKFVLAIYLF